VLINTDDNNESIQLSTKIIADHQLSHLSNYYFVEDQADRSRYIIDKNWYGELPRSYFVNQQGKFQGKSGLIKESLLRDWLKLH